MSFGEKIRPGYEFSATKDEIEEKVKK